jgi:hypothetical protein
LLPFVGLGALLVGWGRETGEEAVAPAGLEGGD